MRPTTGVKEPSEAGERRRGEDQPEDLPQREEGGDAGEDSHYQGARAVDAADRLLYAGEDGAHWSFLVVMRRRVGVVMAQIDPVAAATDPKNPSAALSGRRESCAVVIAPRATERENESGDGRPHG